MRSLNTAELEAVNGGIGAVLVITGGPIVAVIVGSVEDGEATDD